MKYKYLFPFELVSKNSKIILYGAGEFGQEYLEQIDITGYCTVECFVDLQYEKYGAFANGHIQVCSPNEILKQQYDYIVIAIKNKAVVNEIISSLENKFHIDREKIIYVGCRRHGNRAEDKVASISFFKNIAQKKKFAFQSDKLSIAIKLLGGLGDQVIEKKVFEELIKLFPNCLVDLYVPVGFGESLKAIYTKEHNINLMAEDIALDYKKKCEKYMIALSLLYVISVDYFQFDKVAEYNPNAAKKIALLKKRSQEYDIDLTGGKELSIHSERAKYKGYNCYTAYNYGDVFNIRDNHVEIKLDEEYKNVFEKMNLGKYITVNYGWGSLIKASSKAWPSEYISQFISLFKKKYPDIAVVQLGTQNALKILGVDQYVLGQNLELVKYILKNSILHVDIEGGLVHLGTQLGTKCIVLFGPTPVHYFGYWQNINIVSNKCKECYGLYSGGFQCAKDMEKPECMYSITPKIVMEKVVGYISKRE